MQKNSWYSVPPRARPPHRVFGSFHFLRSPWVVFESGPVHSQVSCYGCCCLNFITTTRRVEEEILGVGFLSISSLFRYLVQKIWPTIPIPDNKFKGLFTVFGGDFQVRLISPSLSCRLKAFILTSSTDLLLRKRKWNIKPLDTNIIIQILMFLKVTLLVNRHFNKASECIFL